MRYLPCVQYDSRNREVIVKSILGGKPNFGVCNIGKDLEDGTIYDSPLGETVNQARKHSNASHNFSAPVPLQCVRLKM